MVTFSGIHYANRRNNEDALNLAEFQIVPVLPIDSSTVLIDMSEPSMAGIAKMARKYHGCSLMVTEHNTCAFFSGSPKIAFEDCVNYLKTEFLNRR